MHVDPKTGEAISASVESAHDPVRMALAALAGLFLPVFEEMFRDRLVTVLSEPIDLSKEDPEVIRKLIRLDHAQDRIVTDEGYAERAFRAFSEGETALEVLVAEMPAADLEERCAAFYGRAKHPPEPSAEQVRNLLFDYAFQVVRNWTNDLLLASRETGVVTVDGEMLVAGAASRWLSSRHPDPGAAAFRIETQEMRTVFRRVKAIHAADRPVPVAIEPILTRFKVTAVLAPV